jgi:phage-related protein
MKGMTIKEKLYFSYNGVSCRDFGLIHINLDNGMYDERLVAERNLNETEVKGNDPLFHSIEESPLEFEMAIAFENAFTDSDIDNVVLWLFQNTYKPLYFEDIPNKIYYALPIGETRIVHTGLKQGYVTIVMRCSSSKVFSPFITTPLYDLSTNVGKFRVNIANSGHLDIYPEISIKKVGAGNITFTHVTNGGKIVEIRNLADAEDIYLNCEKEIIETDIIGVYRYDKVIGELTDLVLLRGNNAFDIEGTCKITFRYRFKYKF